MRVVAFIGTTMMTAAGLGLYAAPAAASLKQVIVIKSLDVGLPPLIDVEQKEKLKIAPRTKLRTQSP